MIAAASHTHPKRCVSHALRVFLGYAYIPLRIFRAHTCLAAYQGSMSIMLDTGAQALSTQHAARGHASRMRRVQSAKAQTKRPSSTELEGLTEGCQVQGRPVGQMNRVLASFQDEPDRALGATAPALAKGVVSRP